ncbi:MAG: hypothetical protein QOI24_2942 [Acidobacteriota bacterium]|nr:hypothetical protein [Acidobacteriota bacterium]
MADSRIRLFHIILAVAMAGSLLVFITTPSSDWKAVAPPDDRLQLADYIATHPADAKASAKITDAALDYPITKRRELWHAAHELTNHLEPYRTNGQIAFARAGVFHWAELSDAERKEVIASIGPLLNDYNRFMALYKPVWALTHDLALLLRHAPPGEGVLNELGELAVTNGLFDEYRRLRAETQRVREEEAAAKRATLTPPQLLQSLRPPFRISDEPLISAVLRELQGRPLDEDPHSSTVDPLIEFAIDHHLTPLEGLEAITRLKGTASDAHRARLALALDLPERASDLELGNADVSAPWRRYYAERAEYEAKHGNADQAELYRVRAYVASTREGKWEGLCDGDLCTNAHAEIDGPRVLTLEMVQSDEVPPWVELYIDDALRDEGPIAPRRVFTVPDGVHRVELRVANPMTRNRFRRRVKIG